MKMAQNSRARRIETKRSGARLAVCLMASASVLANATMARSQPASLPGPQASLSDPPAVQPPAEQSPDSLKVHRAFLFYQPLLHATPKTTALFLSRLAESASDLQPFLSARIGWLANGKGLTAMSHARASDVELTTPGGQLRLQTLLLEDEPAVTQRDFRDPATSDKLADPSQRTTSRRHRLAAQLIDSGNLKLMVDGAMGHVSEGVSATQLPLSNGRFVLPGSWSAVSSRLDYGPTNVTVGYQDFESRDVERSSKQITVGFKASELQVYRRHGTEFSLINGGQWLRRTTFSGISADLLVADVLPGAVVDALDPVRHLLPTSISGGFERGDVTRAEITMGPRDRVSTANLAMTWHGSLGETTASLQERRVSTDMVMPGATDGRKLARSSDRYADISHSMRRGNWKLGAGLSLIQTNDDRLGIQQSDSQIAPHITIGYAPERGPRVELRYGAADAQSQLIDDDLSARSKTRQLQLSVDMSAYAQDVLNRPDASLRLEYRYDFGKVVESRDAGERAREGGHALLVTFSTPLN